eukprot:Clim_evm9s62 gene=Clim_evmTU9s62
MAIHGNNILANPHFHKDWDNRVKTWFNQPGRKNRHRRARAAKAARIAPRPVAGLLRPAVTCQSIKYNLRKREGRGFTLTELKKAGISKKVARTIGIAVDHRRDNKSEESLDANVQRLKEYQSRLIVFPKKKGKVQKGDSADVSGTTQLTGAIIPIVNDKTAEQEPRAISNEDLARSAFKTMRFARANARLVGKREKWAREKAEKEEEKKRKGK